MPRWAKGRTADAVETVGKFAERKRDAIGTMHVERGRIISVKSDATEPTNLTEGEDVGDGG